MRLAIIHAYSWPEVRRGAERIIQELSAALARRGHEVTVLTAGSRPGRTTDHGGATFVRLRRVFGNGARHEYDFGQRVLPRILALRPDAAHAFGPRDAVAAIRAERLGRCGRSVYTNLGIPLRSWWDTRYDRRAHERVLRDVDAYGCMSRYALDVLARDYGREGVLTPGGVNLREFRPATDRSPTPTILLSGAVAERHKGLPLLLRALPLLAREVPDVRVWLSGPGDPSAILAEAPPDVRERVEHLGLGAAHEQADRYGRAWVTTLPSRGDSFGMVMVESLACGTPIVPSNHSALPELVTPGVTGALCEPDDPASLATALAEALDLACKPGTADACRASAEPYDWDRSIAPAFEALYEGH